MTSDILQTLDAEQRYAAETLLGPLCILAGAGFLYLTLALPNWQARLSQLFG